MIKISVKHNIDEVMKNVDDQFKRQVPYATKTAINNTAFKAKAAFEHDIRDVFNRPTPWIQKSVRVIKARDKANPVAQVDFDFWGNKQGYSAADVMMANIKGGSRRLKGFERALQRKGYLEPGEYAVPGKAATDLNMIDAYGNMKAGVIVQILSKLEAFGEVGYTANVTGKKRQRAPGRGRVYWVGRPGRNTPRGIWLIDEKHKRGRGRLRPIIVFVNSTDYEAIFDPDYIFNKTIDAEFQREFAAALAGAIRTAR